MCILYMLCKVAYTPFIVNFDIDQGPVIAGIFPPLTLEPDEAANMYAYHNPITIS